MIFSVFFLSDFIIIAFNFQKAKMIKKKEEKFTVLMNTSGCLVSMKKKLKTDVFRALSSILEGAFFENS